MKLSKAKLSHLIRGFSLIEIMVVIGIIAILLTLAIPSQTGRITQKRVAETRDLFESYKPKIIRYYAETGEFPSDNAAILLPEPNKIIGNYLDKMEVNDGAMHLYFGQKFPTKLHGRILSIRPIYVEDSPGSPVSWICGNDKVPTGMTATDENLTDLEPLFLPINCR